MTLREAAYRYRLTLGGSHVWAPYWINNDNDPFWRDAPLRGKGTAREIGRAARAAAAAERVAPQSPEEWRLLMRRHGLGVDCSGFVFHVLSDWLRDGCGVELAEGLMVGPEEIRDRNGRHPELAQRWVTPGLEEPTTLGDACRRWQMDPVMITSVRRLVDPAVVYPVERAGDARPGDLIVTSKAGGDHIGVVLSVSSGRIYYADSAYEADSGLGGVRCRVVQLVHAELGLEAQAWEQNALYHPGAQGTRDGLWRLRIVEEQAYGGR